MVYFQLLNKVGGKSITIIWRIFSHLMQNCSLNLHTEVRDLTIKTEITASQ